MDFSELYYLEPMRSEFTAQVLSCEPYKDSSYAVTLSRTCFYPEGGGQVGDRGVLNSDELRVEVLDTRYRGEDIIHIVDQPLPVNSEVEGKIDFARRFDLMQQHSGEHIVSGLVHSQYGYHNVGFHLTDKYMTFDFDGPLDIEQLLELERRANQRVQQNIPIEILYPTTEELANIHYRSKKPLSAPIRIVHIADTDTCACCGTHVANTGEVGMIVFENWEKYKSGIRLYASCGQRALNYVQEQRHILKTTAENFSTHYSKLPQILAKQANEFTAVDEARKALAERVIEDHLTEIQRLEQIRNLSLVGSTQSRMYFSHEIWITDLLNAVEMRRAATLLADYLPRFAMVMSPQAPDEYQFVLSARQLPLRTLLKDLQQKINIKGGGSDHLITGKVSGDSDRIVAAIEETLLMED